MAARTVFMGTPDFAVPSLQALLGNPGCEVVGVFTQPDRPGGRGLEVRVPPVKHIAGAAGVPVFQPKGLRQGAGPEALAALAPELIVVAAYGRILPPAVLAMPRLGCVNVHASLLPRYRGAAPINWCIVRGETQTGATLMLMDEGLDTGPILRQVQLPIGPDETAGELHDRLAQVGAHLLSESLNDLIGGRSVPVPQDHALATLAPLLKKEDGRVPWEVGAQSVHNHVRGMLPWPGAWTSWAGGHLRIVRTRVEEPAGNPHAAPGTIAVVDHDGIVVACGVGHVRLLRVQAEGGRAMDAVAFARGHAALGPGARLG
jgi:methionyl-tRNA formyltransferase